MRRRVRPGASFLVVLMLIASGGVAHAQRIPLRGPLHAPIERRLLRSGRLFLAALPGLAVARVEGTRAVVAGRADLHPFDFLGLGAWGSCGLPCGGDDGEVGWAAAGQVTIVPAWGKLALAGEVVVKMDLSAFGGLGAAQRPGGARLVPTFGGGMNLYLGEAVAAALEVRAIWPTTLVSVGLVLALPTAARWERG